MQEIIDQIMQDTTVRWRTVHGRDHWDRVAQYAKVIAAHEKLNQRLLVLFAYFHDCKRHSEGSDPEHGPRAAEYVESFTAEELGLSEEDKQKLIVACRHHTYECDTEDVEIRACWDCDRLDIGRVCPRTDPDKLFTRTAKAIVSGELQVGASQ